MADFVGVRVEGLNRFVRTMRAAGADMTELKKVNKEVADFVLPYALALTPIDVYDGGDLLATGRAAGTQKEAIIRFGKASVPYAGVVHYGYPNGGARTQAAQPWVADAAHATETQWVQIYWDAVEKIIDSVAIIY